MLNRIRRLYCRWFHRKTMLPFKGHYRCPICLCEFPVPWSEGIKPPTLRPPDVSYDWCPQCHEGTITIRRYENVVTGKCDRCTYEFDDTNVDVVRKWRLVGVAVCFLSAGLMVRLLTAVWR